MAPRKDAARTDMPAVHGGHDVRFSGVRFAGVLPVKRGTDAACRYKGPDRNRRL